MTGGSPGDAARTAAMALPFAFSAGPLHLDAYLPEPLLRAGPFAVQWWQWVAIPLGLLVAVLAGKLLGYVTRRVLAGIAQRTVSSWDDLLLERITGPLTLFWTLVVAYLLKLALGLPPPADRRADQILQTAGVAVFFWALLRTVDLGFHAIASTPTALAHGLGRGLLPMLRKATKIGVFVLAVIAVLTDLGYPVASLLAGLGIGGLALALAAQKTVENLFGSFSITVDQPFRIGDFVKIEGGTMGTVEAIGLRSTRVRTLDRTLVTIPNGKLADQRIETFAPRDRCRFACTLGLVYATTSEQMRTVVEGLERVLRAHPRLWPDGVSVRFVALSPSSLDVEAFAWFDTADWNEFQAIRQEVLLRFMAVVEEAGTALAFPTQTLHLRRDAPAAPSSTRGA
jgi:MscS family membrane protein